MNWTPRGPSEQPFRAPQRVQGDPGGQARTPDCMKWTHGPSRSSTSVITAVGGAWRPAFCHIKTYFLHQRVQPKNTDLAAHGEPQGDAGATFGHQFGPRCGMGAAMSLHIDHFGSNFECLGTSKIALMFFCFLNGPFMDFSLIWEATGPHKSAIGSNFGALWSDSGNVKTMFPCRRERHFRGIRGS